QYDSDGDGIANAHDPFPGNANMDSWFDLILRLMLLLGVVIGGLSLFQRRKAATADAKWDMPEDDTQRFIEAEEMESLRPSAPPSSEAFQYKD
ncbi:MAG: hypothetical protein NLN65_06110, partial [Candidatus Poseidoniaceae archaeon]|nr:hypothetical protein [Candidatus Poseidoniaceae archaeon]